MKKIKIFNILFILFSVCNIVSAESLASLEINRKNAELYLEYAEKSILNENWNSVLHQSELGITNDSTISDLYYVKALAMAKLGKKRAEVLPVIQEAFHYDKWVNYNENRARILYADVLSEIGKYQESLDVLNKNQFIYSADAEYIRIKNYYREGTADSINKARAKVDAVRKIYPSDKRFPQLFFNFEMIFMNYAQRNQTEYKVPELVLKIADDYIQKLPDYDNDDVETEIMALLFSSGEQQKRLLKAIGEKKSDIPLFALVGLETGILSEEKAYNLFFESSENTYYLNILETFCTLIKNEGLKQNLYKLLNSFEGLLYIDENLDLRNELIVQYERGRPSTVYYDVNNDNIAEIYALCDFGEPLSIFLENQNVNIHYEKYPNVKNTLFVDKNLSFNFLDDDFTFIPFEIIADKTFSELGLNFFIPYVNQEISFPDEYFLVEKAALIDIKTTERDNSKATYSAYKGQPIHAVFSNNSKMYGYSTIAQGLPFVRYVDYDNDDVFETMETFDFINKKQIDSSETKDFVQRVFGINAFSSELYLKKVEIDRNQNTIVEFSEEYLENNQKKSFWDKNEDGFWDYSYYKYQNKENENVTTEEYSFYNDNGTVSLVLTLNNKIPDCINYEGNYYPVIQGDKKSLYWIEKKGSAEVEEQIEKNIKKSLADGVITLVDYTEKERLLIIKIENIIYCRLIPVFEAE